jgi:hypothetical protein
MALYHVTFIRGLSDDLEVIANKGLPTSVKSFADQLSEEFAPHLNEDGLSLRLGSTYIKNDDGSYVLEGYFEMPQEEVEHRDESAWEKRLTHLEEFLSWMQSAYEDGVAGAFEVVSVQHGSSTFPGNEIVLKAAEARRQKGTDLLDLSPGEVFDRTKKQNGDVAMITSGEFAPNGLNQNNTAYAVGTVDGNGFFHPIASNLRLGQAETLFNNTCDAAAARRNDTAGL